MSFKAMSWATSIKTGSPTKKLILLMLADRANAEGFCWPSMKTLMADCEMSREAISRNIKQMEESDFLHITKHNNKGQWKNNVYHLHVTLNHTPCDLGSHDHVTHDHANLSTEPVKESNTVAGAPEGGFETQPTQSKPSPSQSKKNVVFRAPTRDEVAKWAGEWALKKERNAAAVVKVAEEARTYYERLDWTNRNGKAVKVWKTTIAGNWLTDEKIVKAQGGQFTPTTTMTEAQSKAQGLNIF